MNRHHFVRKIAIAHLLGAALLFGLVATASAQLLNSGGQPVPVPNAGQPLQRNLLDKNRQITVVLKLADEPVAVVRSRMPGRHLSEADRKAIAGRIRAKQDAMMPSIQAHGVRVLGRMQHAINGIKVRGTADQIAALARFPGVVEVKPVGIYRIENAESVPFIGTPSVWAGPPGLHGEHIKIAVLDTGIDYTHANFGGPGTVSAFQIARATNTQPADSALFGPDAPKVKGGTDLVGDNYDAGSSDPAKNTPIPDPNPLDCNGHGSHVAGTAAGFGVLSDGTTFHGPYDAATPSRSFIIGPGVAPQADVYSVRVFGCSGSTDVVTEAIDWAVANGMQVISMSLGSNFEGKSTADAEAATNAANAGVIVVAASGNAGAIPYITSSPAAADKAISVAAMDSHGSFPAAALALSPSGNIVAIDANGVSFSDGALFPVLVLPDTKGTGINGVSLGCDPAEYTAAGVTGKMVVTARGVCGRVDRAIYGQQAGAAAVAMINSTPGYPPFEGPITSNPDTGARFTVTIPFLGIQGLPSTDAVSLKAASQASLGNTTTPNPTFRQFASFSSEGPRLGDANLKPDITAPGVSIFSTASGTGNQGLYESGTSMATPHVAGVAALALQAHPTWDPDQVRLGVVNTAGPAQLAGYSAKLGGAGLVQPLPATLTSVVAKGNADAPSLSFGLQEFTSDFQGSGDITLQNLGSQAATFNISTTPNPSSSPHSVQFTPTSVTVPASGTAAVHITLSIPAATNGDSSAFHDAAGIVAFTPMAPTDNAGAALQVPYYAVSRARAQITSTVGPSFGIGNPATTAQLSNTSTSVGGSAQLFAWGLTGQNSSLGFFGIRAVGVQSFNDSSGRNVVRFALNTFAPLGYAGIGQFSAQINVFLNGHTSPDYEIFTEDFGLASTGTYSGQVAAIIFNAATRALTADFFAAAPNDGSTIYLPVFAADIGVTPANPRFSYGAETFSVLNPDFSFSASLLSDSISQAASFNAFHSSLTTGSSGIFIPAGATVNVPLSIDANEFSLTPANGVMIASLDNASGATQAQLLPFASTSPTLQSITIEPSSASIAAGLTQQFTATGHYSDNTTQDLTNSVTWNSSPTNVATINASGLATGVTAGGPAIITATQAGASGSAQLTVTPAVLQSITLSPGTASVAAGLTQPFTATGHYSDRTTQDVTNSVTWSSSDNTIATINAAGLATGAKAGGPITITGTQGNVSGTAQFTVTAAVLQSIGVSPNPASVAAGLSQPFTASAHYSDKSIQDVTTAATWSSSDNTIATISATGVAAGLKAGGPITITATLGSTSGAAQLTVTGAVPQTITLTPNPASVAAGLTQQFNATGHFSDNTTQDLTNTVAWKSSDISIATVSATGAAMAVKVGGPVTITATQGDASGFAQLTVTPAVLQSITVSPTLASIAAGITQQFTATGHYSDNTSQDLTSSVTWSSSPTNVATINASGLATGVSAGASATITATLGGASGSAQLTVTPAVLQSIAVSPGTAAVPAGLTQRFTATGHYSDNSAQDLTNSVAWTSSDNTIATISATGIANGVKTGGPVTITAAQGSAHGAAQLIVTAPLLQTITVAPASASVAAGSTQPFTATGHYSDSTAQDLTHSVAWTSSDVAIAAIGNTGVATALKAGGPVTITATQGSVHGTAQLTVTAGFDQLVAAATFSKDGSGQYVAHMSVRNAGSATANSAQLIAAFLNTTAASPSALMLGNISAGTTVTFTLTFAASSGASGTAAVLKTSYSYSGGALTSSQRLSLP